MSTRTTETTVTFRRSFTLSALEGAQPAGTYRVITAGRTDFRPLLHRHPPTATLLYLPADPVPGGTRQVVSVSPDELAEALPSDAA